MDNLFLSSEIREKRTYKTKICRILWKFLVSKSYEIEMT